MAEDKTKTAEAAKPLTLQQKFVKLREAIPAIEQKQYSDAVKYKFVRIYDVFRYLTPALNEWGVNFDIIGEKATRHDANGDDLYYHSYIQHTKNGDRIIWVYEADIALRWTNADDPTETLDVTLHAIGCNDGSPDKAKGSALTYAMKYMLFNKFSIDQGDDPDMNDYSSDVYAPLPYYNGNSGHNGGGNRNYQQKKQSAESKRSDAQLDRLYRKAEDSGYTRQQVDSRIAEKYGQKDPHDLTRAQYDEICAAFDALKQQGGNTNA